MRAFLVIFAFAVTADAADQFTGWQSCSTTGCHGGGTGNDQVWTWRKHDRHARAHGTLISERSQRIAEALKIPEAAKSAQCTVCHSPMQSAAQERIAKDLKHPNHGVSCEACHGPASGWLRFHTRPDITRAQRIAAGLRDLDSAWERANSCVGCHANIAPGLLAAGHPALRFEMARQLHEMPVHWKNHDPSQAPQSWLASQAVLLRELCAQPASPQLTARIAALHWLLRETADGTAHLPESADPEALRPAADKLARAASATRWTPAKTRAQLDRTAALAAQISAPADFPRAEALIPALRALALGIGSEPYGMAREHLAALDLAIRSQATFDPASFNQAVQALLTALAPAKP